METGDARPLRIEVMGPVQVFRGGRGLAVGPPRQQAVLAMLALRPNRVVSRDELVDGVWGASPPASAINGVHTHIWALRRVLEPDRGRRAAGESLASAGSGYRLALEPDQLDVTVFTAHVASARQRAIAGDALAAVAAFDAALDLWRGTPLAGLPGPAAEAERIRLSELRLAVVEERAEAMLAGGQHAALTAHLSAVVAEHPLREQLRALLMTALYRSGRQAAALALYVEGRRLLVDELGVEPGPDLQRVYRDILTKDDAYAVLEDAGTGAPTEPRRSGRSARPGVVPRQLPAAMRHFTGRVAELAVMTRLLDDGETAAGAAAAAVCVIGGTAGVGKTTLAVSWAHRVAHRFPDGQMYVNLRGFDPAGPPLTPAEAVRGFLDAFEVPPQRVPADLPAQVGLYRSLLAGRRVLVVLDNARDADQVRPLLPGAPGCHAVVTSRNRLTGLTATVGAYPMYLDLFTNAEARQLLAGHLGPDRVAAEPAAIDEIIRKCARLPLALSIAAAHAAAQPGFSLAVLAAELCDAAHGGLDAFAGTDAATDVHAVFGWSYRTLSPGTAGLFRLLGLYPGPEVSIAAAASLAALPASQVRPLLADLTRANLVVEPTPGRYTFHDLLRTYAADLARTTETDGQRRAAIHRLIDHYLHTAHAAARLLAPTRDRLSLAPPQPGVIPEHPADHQQALAWLTAERTVLLAAVDHAAATGFDTHTWQLAWTLDDFLHWRGSWHDQAAAQHAAVAAAHRLADLPIEARAHRYLAHAYNRLGRFDDAHTHLRHALDLTNQVGDLVGQAHTHYTLAHVWERQGRYSQALDHARQALDLYRVGGDRQWQATALNGVGWCHALLGDHRQALTACQQALRLHQKLGDHIGQAATWDSLGYAHHHLGHYAQAVACYQHAIDLYRILGNRYDEADTLTHLGDTHHAAANPDAASDAWQQALAILDDLDHPDADPIRTKLQKHQDSDKTS